jgi:hypothetical protein
MKKHSLNKSSSLFIALLLGIVLAGCNLGNAGNTTSPSALAEAEVVFQVALPAAIPGSSGVVLEILDEVTGLAFNPTRYQMQPVTATTFFVRVNLPVNSVIKYRFSRLDNIAIPEYTTDNHPVRYRLYEISGPAVIQDSVAAWMDQPYSGQTGRLQGQISDGNGNPVPGMLVSVCGVTTVTAVDGTYQIENIIPGTHTLLALSPTGTYATFQQGAVIAANATTPAEFTVATTPSVNITFVVNLPAMDYSKSPLRIIGSLAQLGNTFQDLDGGFSILTANAPVLGRLSDQQYALTISLPVGTYIEYKYSLGDGFWNAEHDSAGSFYLHKIVVPNKDTIITDAVNNWGKGTNGPVTFTVQVPASTASTDLISIQFNPFTWTAPIPMWNEGNNIWSYVLYSPLDIVGQMSYRYCRNNLCGSLDTTSIGTKFSSSGKEFTTTPSPQTFTDIISE